MSSTIIDMPNNFNAEIVNKVIGKEKYDKNSFTEDELLDLWGFLKHFESNGEIDVTENCIKTFEQLCENVNQEQLRYPLLGSVEAPYIIAQKCSNSEQEDNDTSYDNTSRGKRSINLEREQKKPAYVVIEESSSHVVVVIDTDSVEIIDGNIHLQGSCLPDSDIFDNPEDYSNPKIKKTVDSVTHVRFEKQ